MSPARSGVVSPNRQRVLDHVRLNPGCSLQDVTDAMGLTRTSVVHHLRALVHRGEIGTERQGRRLLHFASSSPLPGPRSLLGMLRVDSTRRVVEAVHADPTRSVRSLARLLGLTPHTVRWHLGRLEREGLLQVHGRVLGPRRIDLHPAMRQALGQVEAAAPTPAPEGLAAAVAGAPGLAGPAGPRLRLPPPA